MKKTKTKTGLPLKLAGVNENAFAVMGEAQDVLKKNGMADRVVEFIEEATDGDYDALLRTCSKWFEVK